MHVGTELKQARERAGLSAEQISERTKIQLHKIEALENGNFEGLPDGIYLDGIVRAYAVEVGIDPGPLIEGLRRERPPVETDWAIRLPPESETVPAGRPARAASPPIDFDLSEEPARPTAPPPARTRRALALPIMTVLAVTGWAAYIHEATGRDDGDPTRAIDRSATAGTPSAAAPIAVAPSRSNQDERDRETPSSDRISSKAIERSPAGTSGKAHTPPPPTPPSPSPAPAENAAAPATPTSAEAHSPVDAGSTHDVSGPWTLTTRVESSSYARFAGLQLGYDIQLRQAGNRVTGAGRKVAENGTGLEGKAQTPVLVEGYIEGERLTLTFTERGARRPTQGKFILLLHEGGTLRGRFSSNAARSSGTVEAHRPQPADTTEALPNR
jgi:transcriptional regulator with XRE-family HTH domain